MVHPPFLVRCTGRSPATHNKNPKQMLLRDDDETGDETIADLPGHPTTPNARLAQRSPRSRRALQQKTEHPLRVLRELPQTAPQVAPVTHSYLLSSGLYRRRRHSTEFITQVVTALMPCCLVRIMTRGLAGIVPAYRRSGIGKHFPSPCPEGRYSILPVTIVKL
jgi:hypothetical protein